MTSTDTSGTASSGAPAPGTANIAVRAKDVVIARVRAMRAERGWSAAALAARCAELGAPEMTTNVIRNLESRARGVSVEQLLVFALALDVPPAYLLTPEDPQPADAEQEAGAPNTVGVAITDSLTVTDPATMNRWVSGTQPLPPTREDVYTTAAAKHRAGNVTGSTDVAGRMIEQFEQQAERFVASVRDDVTRLLDETAQQIAAARDPEVAVAALKHARDRVTPS